MSTVLLEVNLDFLQHTILTTLTKEETNQHFLCVYIQVQQLLYNSNEFTTLWLVPNCDLMPVAIPKGIHRFEVGANPLIFLGLI